MKQIIVILLAIYSSLYSQSIYFNWVQQINGYGDTGGNDVYVDDSLNMYTGGFFRDTVDADPGPGTFLFSSSSLSNMYIIKQNSNGVLVWAKSITAPTGGISANSITVDDNGNLFVAGNFHNGVIDFDPGADTSNLTSTGPDNIFILKIDPNGNFSWVKQFNSLYHQSAASVTTDSDGSVYTVGWYSENADFDPGPSTHYLFTAPFAVNGFISKLDSTGSFVWVREFYSNNFSVINAIALDKSGNIFTTGICYDSTDFDPGVGTYIVDNNYHDHAFLCN